MNPLGWAGLAAVAAVLSGFFALTGHSLRAFRRAVLEEALEGPRRSAKLNTLDRHLTALRLTTSLWRALANAGLLVSMFFLFEAGGSSLRLLGAVAAAAVVIALFGVAIPNAWASCSCEKIVAATMSVLMVFRYAAWPIVAAMQAFDLPVRRLAGVSDSRDENGDAAKQEILQAATDGHAEGAVDAEEVEMIESVMEFGDTHVGEIMTPRTDIFALPVEADWSAACSAIVEQGRTRVPVYQGDLDNIIGILYAKDLLREIDGEHAPLRSIMRKPYFVPETKLLDDLLRELKTRKVHLAIILDEYGGTAGLVTIEDLVEEIVGEISDEYDRPEPALMHRVDERTATVDGRMYIDDLNDAMGLQAPEDEDYDTVAGLVFSELGYVPAAGETLEAFGAKYTILKADERRIIQLRVEVPGKAKGT